MYDRKYGNRTVNFEASGGLMHSSLVMQDRETDTYWSIMAGEAVAGELKGNKLVELPVSKKIKWEDWVKIHPDTLVLSVNGREDIRKNPYSEYFQNSSGFRGSNAKDKRLKTKDSIYAFAYQGKKYAALSKKIMEGRVFEIEGGAQVFLYRRKKADIFESTVAYVSRAGFEKKNGVWIEKETGARFDEKKGEFVGGEVAPLNGFDTFWYNWSLNNPDTGVLQ